MVRYNMYRATHFSPSCKVYTLLGSLEGFSKTYFWNSITYVKYNGLVYVIDNTIYEFLGLFTSSDLFVIQLSLLSHTHTHTHTHARTQVSL